MKKSAIFTSLAFGSLILAGLTPGTTQPDPLPQQNGSDVNATGSASFVDLVALSEENQAAIEMAMQEAESVGLDPEQLAQHVDGQVFFSEVVNEFRRLHGQHYISSRWLGGEGLLIVTAGGAELAEPLFDRYSVRGTSEERNMPNATAIEQVQTAILDSIYAEHGAIANASVDLERGTISVNVDRDLPRSEAELVSEIDTLGFEVSITVDPDAMDQAAAARGGVGYNPSYCTGGFIVRQGTPLRYGVLTARHCTSWPTVYDGNSTNGSVYHASGRDLRVIWLNGSVTRTFRSNTSTYTTATGQGDPSIGYFLCRWGKVTGRQCGSVYDDNYCSTGVLPGTTQCGLYKVSPTNVVGGDSGGPWFTGGRAYGITSGYGPVNAPVYDLLVGAGANNLSVLGVVVHR